MDVDRLGKASGGFFVLVSFWEQCLGAMFGSNGRVGTRCFAHPTHFCEVGVVLIKSGSRVILKVRWGEQG